MKVYNIIFLAALIQATCAGPTLTQIMEIEKILQDSSDVRSSKTEMVKSWSNCKDLLADVEELASYRTTVLGFVSNFTSNVTSDISEFTSCLNLKSWTTDVYCVTSLVKNITQDVLDAEVEFYSDWTDIESILKSMETDLVDCFSFVSELYVDVLSLLN